MRAETAAKLVAKFIGKDYERNRDEIFEILTMAVNKAWKEGKWFGMTREVFVPIRENSYKERYIIAPEQYPILLAININGKPGVDIRSKNFIFHHNGNGDIKDRNGCKWNTNVFDMGETPVLDESRINVNSPVRIGVRALGAPGENEKLFVKGSYGDGSKVFTYKNREYGSACACVKEKDEIETVSGVELSITSNFNYISNIPFTSITSIEKTLTRTPIEVIAINEDSSAFVAARMEPGQRRTKYRKYIVPDKVCNETCIHGLFKIAPQQDISSPHDEVIINDPEILISLAMSIDMIYYKGDVEKGSAYFLQAISMLDKQKREEESPEEFPIQVSMDNNGDHDILNYV